MVYLATLLSMVNTYMISLMHQIIFYTSEDILATFFPTCVIFTSFTFIALAKTSNTIWIKMGESGYSHFVPGFHENPLKFPPFSKMLTEGKLYMLCQNMFPVFLDVLELLP